MNTKEKEDNQIAEETNEGRESGELMLHQYDQAWTRMRTQQDRAWQLPAFAITLVSGMYIAAYRFLDGFPRILVLFGGLFLAVVMTITLAKYRFWSGKAIDVIHEIEEMNGRKKFQLINIDVQDDQNEKIRKNNGEEYMGDLGYRFGNESDLIVWLRKRSAGKMLFTFMILIVITVFISGIYEIVVIFS